MVASLAVLGRRRGARCTRPVLAGVKCLTEALQHKLRSTEGCQVNAFLLVPGCVNTMIRTRGDRWIEGDAFKPDRAKDEREYNGVKDRVYAAKMWKDRGAWEPSARALRHWATIVWVLLS